MTDRHVFAKHAYTFIEICLAESLQIIRKVGVDNYYFRNIYTQEGYLQYTQFFDMTEEGYSDTVKSSQLRKFIMRNHDYKYEADGDYKLTEIPDGMHWLSITPGINLDNKSIWVVELSQYGKKCPVIKYVNGSISYFWDVQSKHRAEYADDFK